MHSRLETEKSRTVPLGRVRIRDSFWSSYIDLVEKSVIPYQWDALNDRIENAPPSHAIRNFRIAAGEEQGEFYGMVFQDSDVAKWLEAVAYLLTIRPNPELEKTADETIDLIARAQQPDGYLNTYFTVKEPGKRWTNLCECHELYCAGHMIEAGVAYYYATGKRKLLDVVCKLADHIDSVFGPEEGKLRGYDGHQEIELALMKLYEATGNERYLKLSRFFLEERGKQPHFYDLEAERRGRTYHWGPFMVEKKEYSQAHKPVKEQDRAVGHAVRFAYMATGMAHVAAETGDAELAEACRRLFDSVTSRNLYVTGAIGSQSHGESFSTDYDLPNDTAYAETCASIGLIFFAYRMLMLEPRSRYADVLERALYNTVVGGMSRDGKRFFYVNPLEVYPRACEANHIYHHVKPERQPWFGCACCPPNVARLLASLGQYICTVRGKTVYIHLYIGSEAQIELDNGARLTLEQQTEYPWDGHIRFTVGGDAETEATLALRLPEWCEQAEVRVNGAPEPVKDRIADGYIRLSRRWRPGDQVELALSMPVSRVYGHPLIRQAAGKVALQRGPVVYCLEEADNGPDLHHLLLPRDAEFALAKTDPPIEGMVAIKATALRRRASGWGDVLYRREAPYALEKTEATFIPYFAWANRGVGEMRVWVEEA